MGKVYESLKDVVTQRSKNISVVSGGEKDTHASSLNEEIRELEESIVPRIGRFKAAIKEREAAVAGEARRVEQVIENLRAKIAMLENQLKEAEETTRRKDIASQKIEERLTAEVHGLQDELKNNKETLQRRDAEIKDLKSQLQLLTRGVKEMSSFFKQAEALAGAELPSGSSVVAKEPTNKVVEKPAGTELKGTVVTSKETASSQQTMPTNFVDRVTHELTQIMGPMAPVIVRDKVASLGESMEKLPNSRVRELLEIISKEILNENAKARFRVCFREYM
jgi:DNA repair exonuclease SbcCD ATPase subunit